MQNFNQMFEDKMDEINAIGKSYGFVNGIDWADAALEKREITEVQFKQFKGVHNLRNSFSHGHARDIFVSLQTYSISKKFFSLIKTSKIRSCASPKTSKKSRKIVSKDANIQELSKSLFFKVFGDDLGKILGHRKTSFTYDDLLGAARVVVWENRDLAFGEWYGLGLWPTYPYNIFNKKKWIEISANNLLNGMYDWEIDSLLKNPREFK